MPHYIFKTSSETPLNFVVLLCVETEAQTESKDVAETETDVNKAATETHPTEAKQIEIEKVSEFTLFFVLTAILL